MPLEDFPQAYAFAKEMATHMRNSVITDQVNLAFLEPMHGLISITHKVVHIVMDKSETIELLKQHLFDNLVVERLNGSPTLYRQTKVI